jgi:magnesium transporter
MENLVFSEGNEREIGVVPSAAPQVSEGFESIALDEKNGRSTPIIRTRFWVPHPALTSRLLLRCRGFLHSIVASLHRSQHSRTKSLSTVTTLRRLARTRRLVTSLTRLLATKSEVVVQIRKRLLTSNSGGNGLRKREDVDVAIYLGDVQGMFHVLLLVSCHFLTLQASRSHSITATLVVALRTHAKPVTSHLLIAAEHQRGQS